MSEGKIIGGCVALIIVGLAVGLGVVLKVEATPEPAAKDTPPAQNVAARTESNTSAQSQTKTAPVSQNETATLRDQNARLQAQIDAMKGSAAPAPKPESINADQLTDLGRRLAAGLKKHHEDLNRQYNSGKDDPEFKIDSSLLDVDVLNTSSALHPTIGVIRIKYETSFTSPTVVSGKSDTVVINVAPSGRGWTCVSAIATTDWDVPVRGDPSEKGKTQDETQLVRDVLSQL